jgi:hypothetical protein
MSQNSCQNELEEFMQLNICQDIDIQDIQEFMQAKAARRQISGRL